MGGRAWHVGVGVHVTCYSCPRTAAAHFAASSGPEVAGEGEGGRGFVIRLNR